MDIQSEKIFNLRTDLAALDAVRERLQSELTRLLAIAKAVENEERSRAARTAASPAFFDRIVRSFSHGSPGLPPSPSS